MSQSNTIRLIIFSSFCIHSRLRTWTSLYFYILLDYMRSCKRLKMPYVLLWGWHITFPEDFAGSELLSPQKSYERETSKAPSSKFEFLILILKKTTTLRWPLKKMININIRPISEHSQFLWEHLIKGLRLFIRSNNRKIIEQHLHNKMGVILKLYFYSYKILCSKYTCPVFLHFQPWHRSLKSHRYFCS